jgi:hypothetical protein
VDRPESRWESSLVVINRKRAVERLTVRFANLSEDEKYLLVDLCTVRNC